MDFGLFLQKLKSELQLPLPGESAQWRMAPAMRQKLSGNYSALLVEPKQSAILICIYPYSNSIFTVLTLRPAEFGFHSDQISFPGGKFEESDPNLESTALRETYEELGIEAASLTIIGKLTPVYIPVSNFLVHPFIAFTETRPHFILNQIEVKQIIETDISIFLNKSIKSKGVFLSYGKKNVEASYYEVNQQKIWGATAMIISEMEDILSRILFPLDLSL